MDVETLILQYKFWIEDLAYVFSHAVFLEIMLNHGECSKNINTWPEGTLGSELS